MLFGSTDWKFEKAKLSAPLKTDKVVLIIAKFVQFPTIGLGTVGSQI